MTIEEYLEKKEDYFTFSELNQKETAEKILKKFEDINLVPRKKILRIELEDPNTVVIIPDGEKNRMNYAAPPTDAYGKYRIRWSKLKETQSLIIETKKSEDKPIYILIIRGFGKGDKK